MVEDPGNRQSSSMGAQSIEWMKVCKPVAGWTPLIFMGKEHWTREVVQISLSSSGQLAVTVSADSDTAPVPPTVFDEPKKDDDDDSDTDSWNLWYSDWADNMDTEEQEEEDDDDNQFDMGDLTDLVAAIKKAKELKTGDKVTRNPQCWEGHGNEDGGEGTVGKVVRVEENRVQVQWPNGTKAAYCWGEQGKFELVKVGSADDDDDWGRDIANDDKWVPLLKKGQNTKIRCSACSGNSGNESGNGWFRCNQCSNTNLCKKCFKLMEHPEHEFTDMAALAEIMKSTDIVRGSVVRIRPDLKEPKNGWMDAPHDGEPGVVSELDEDIGTVTVLFRDEPWYGLLSEIVVVNVKAEEYATTWLGTLINLAQLSKKNAPCLHLTVDQELAPPVVVGKFSTGQKVKALYPPNNRWYPGVVRAVLPQGRYSILYDDGDTSDKVTEDQIKLNPFVKGTPVRLRSISESGDFTISLGKGVKNGMVGEVVEVSTHSYGSQALRLRVKIRNGMKHISQHVLDSEVELVGDAKWFMKKHDLDADGNAINATGELLPIPKSAVTSIDRAFSNGFVSADVYIRDGTYHIKFETSEIVDPKTLQVIGTLVRDPPQQWIKQPEKFSFDDGKWHVVSLIIGASAEMDLMAFCDGKPMNVEYNGPEYSDSDEETEESSERTEASEVDDTGHSPEGAAAEAQQASDAKVDYARKEHLLDLIDLWTRVLLHRKPETDVEILDCMLEAVVRDFAAARENPLPFASTSVSAMPTDGTDDPQPILTAAERADIEATSLASDGEGEEEPEEEEEEEREEEASENEREDEEEAPEDESGADDQPEEGDEGEEESSAADEVPISGWKEAHADEKDDENENDEDGEDNDQGTADEDGKAGSGSSESSDSSVADLLPLKRKPIEVLSLDVRYPVTLMSFPSGTIDMNVRQKLGPDFPLRRLGKVYFAWGQAVSDEAAKQVFSDIDEKSLWVCKHCDGKNSRLADACGICRRERVEDDTAKSNKRTKVRVALPKSKEAQEVRKKMHARLRAQYQKQLESLDDNMAGVL